MAGVVWTSGFPNCCQFGYSLIVIPNCCPFGYGDFRGPQIEIIRTLVGGGDAFVLMPTGSGKSICYQIPAMMRPGTRSWSMRYCFQS